MAQSNKTERYLFHQGTYFKAYEYLGAHKITDEKGTVYTVFRTWAPNADSVYVTGDFNNWDESSPMTRISKKGLWELKIKLDFKNEDKIKYKYLIFNHGKATFKADPYGVYAGTHEETATYLYDLQPYPWTDGGWLRSRKKAMCPTDTKPAYTTPVNIYEVHLGSFMRKPGGDYLNYRELADRLGPYVKRMGYTHVELLPVAEHPLDESWGYQICGFYAPTSRFGEPADFMYFINKLHSYGIGVLLDWVPAHFSKDEHGLYEFDGTPCYEYQGEDRKEHKVWGTRFFDVGREEVRSFLISNALYWLTEYHVDGLRVDAVASMLYLDFDKKPGEWIPSHDGSNKNYEAIDFFKKLNCAVFERFSDVLMAAEESTAWPMVTKPVYLGGLGFNFKWNMGFVNDMMKYVSTDPVYRSKIHNELTFSMTYSFSENFILAVSHDEVVHGKKSLLDKMYGDYDQKFAGFRTFLTYMMCHPGKKLLFMGSEYGQFKEWDCSSQLEWFMTGYEKHADLLRFTSALNHFYLDTKELWERDFSWDGFRWVKVDDADKNTAVFLRYGADGDFVLCAFNFSAAEIKNYTVGVPEAGLYREIFSTSLIRSLPVPAKKIKSDGFERSIKISMPPLSASIYKGEILKPINK
ncbi:MAG: 1,4-alpha-glucan branching protein GlgB [Clostridia bacterium]|nr:1,4-alpha-glucan branching protein GlgB [Clostridia bacterium]